MSRTRTSARLIAAATLLAVTAPALAAAPAGAQDSAAGATVTVTPATALDPGATVTITGSGFGAGVGVYVRLCEAADGEAGTAEGRPGADRCLGDPQHWVSPLPGGTAAMAGGAFTATLAVPSSFNAEGREVDCTTSQCGIAVRRDHMGGAEDFSYDSFTPLTFAATGEEPAPVPTEPEGPATPEQPAITEGALDWGVKASFRAYLATPMAAGTTTVAPPATTNPDGSFRFPLAEAQGAGDDATASFTGGVSFTAHGGALDLTLSDLRVDIDGTTGTLVLDASSKDRDTGETVVYDDVLFADLTVPATKATYAGVTATLTEAGAEAFSGFYEPGEALDALTITLGAPPAAPVPAPTAPTQPAPPTGATAGTGATLPATGNETTVPITAAAILLAAGAALVAPSRCHQP